MITSPSIKQIRLLSSSGAIDIIELLKDLRHYNLLNRMLTEELVLAKTAITPGSLMKPSFSLSKTKFSTLGRSIQAIYHLGGNMSLLKYYETLRRILSSSTSSRDGYQRCFFPLRQNAALTLIFSALQLYQAVPSQESLLQMMILSTE
ncbi:hypothetical protein G7Y89_g9706 [Cudoniella acicularis]|uniref:Thioester reductase (TE) domain-containing protein n=1 Tax=Cudoniella acicularis TaxID=354080 RepID=A0A8H4VZD7_9HELO|nr:hypothetical protein G7Y89_g9706 [Cudoniella acicularis]